MEEGIYSGRARQAVVDMLDGRVTVHDVARLLPDASRVADLCRSMAVLEAILNPGWRSRRYRFATAWTTEEELASMDNGAGDEYSIVLSSAGAYIRCFDHESVMSPYENDGPWPGVLDSVPQVFQHLVTEPEFCDETGMPVVTACLWRQSGDDHWRTGTIEFPEDRYGPDGSDWLLALLTDRSPEAFQDFAEDYYGVPVDIEAVRHIYALRPLTREVVYSLNAELTLEDLTEDITTAGYPPSAGR